MKKTLAISFLFLLLIGLASAALAETATLKPSGNGKWAIISPGGHEIGTLGKMDNGAYSILPKGGYYLGVVRKDGNLQLTGRHPVITPADAQLYLDVLEAIKTLK